MKTAIIYHSEHHGNTKKLLDSIMVQGDVTLIDATGSNAIDLSGYDMIGFASGIYYQKFHKSVLDFAEKNLPGNKKVFLIYTYGVKRESYADAIKSIAALKSAEIIGVYSCPGYNTFGLFKIVGGIDKGHPNDEDLEGAVKFYQGLCKG